MSHPTLILVLYLAAGCAPSAPAEAPSNPVQASRAPAAAGMSAGAQARISRWQALNGACRGGSGDAPTTVQACEARDAAFDSLEGLGWCYGAPGQAGFEKEWHRCTSP